MRFKKYIVSLFIIGVMLFSLNPITAFADSPVTSTDFHKAYMDIEIVKIAKEKGIIDAEIANYLNSSKNPIDVKAAVINALGWNFDGKNNAENYVKLMYSKDIDKLDLSLLSGDEIFCISYMKALDDYFHPDKALPMMEKAYEKNSTSFTVAIVRAILKSQDDMLNKGNWQMVWSNTESVLNSTTFQKDMRQEGVDIIVEYMKLYKQ